jgi:alkaline phosphatase
MKTETRNPRNIISHSSFLIFFFFFSFLISSAQSPKYIFFFIGDGFGIGALTYSEIKAKERGDMLCFSQFPVTGLIKTHAQDDLVPCSAAAATALASGEKTTSYMLNVAPDSVSMLNPISKILHKNGYWIGIATSVSLDHATPAAFYANSINRKDYYDIAKQIPISRFRYFAGSGFLDPAPKDSTSILSLLMESGYAVYTSLEQCQGSMSLRNVLIQPLGKDSEQFPYAIRKDKSDFTLAQITQLGIEKLSVQRQPFFFMVEGGLIDWAAHDNLAIEMYREVKEFSDAIEVALDFYKKHPKETLIIVTADHDTGGGFISAKGLNFTTKDHTGDIVPVFAIGAGAENFSGLYDNTEIMKKILKTLHLD